MAFPPKHYKECIGAKKHLVLSLSHVGLLGLADLDTRHKHESESV